MKKYLKVSDVEVGDLLSIRDDLKSYPDKFFKFKEEREFICLRWTHEFNNDFTGKILIYLGTERMGRFLYHKFSCEGEKLFTRSRNFRFLRKI